RADQAVQGAALRLAACRRRADAHHEAQARADRAEVRRRDRGAVRGVKRHQELLTDAIARDGDAQRALLAGRTEEARAALLEAAELYRSSWEEAPPASYGRLVGMLKAAVLAGGGAAQAEYVRSQLGDGGAESPTAAY